MAVITVLFLKHLFYSNLAHRAWVIRVTRFHILCLALYLTGNIVCMCTGVGQNRERIGSRVDILSTINLIPLLTGTRLSLTADTLGISLRSHISLHRWIGIISTIQAVIHVLFLGDRNFREWDLFKISGAVVSMVSIWYSIVMFIACRRWRLCH